MESDNNLDDLIAATNPTKRSVTSTPVTTFTHLWTIKNFKRISSYSSIVLSPNFTTPKTRDAWFIKLRPKVADNVNPREFIGAHLFLRRCGDSRKTEVRAKYLLSVIDRHGDRRFTGECSDISGRIFTAGVEGHGYRQLAPRDVVVNPESDILGPEESLNIFCEISLFGDMCHDLEDHTSTIIHSESKLAKCSIAVDLGKLLNDEDGKDFVLETMESKEIKVHQFVLTMRSTVFRAMLAHDSMEKINKRVKIVDFGEKVLAEMIYFMYTDTTNSMREMALELMLASDKYNIMKLKKLCEQHLSQNINVTNVGMILLATDSISSFKLKSLALNFISKNATKVASKMEWQQAVFGRPKLLNEAFHVIAKKRRIL